MKALSVNEDKNYTIKIELIINLLIFNQVAFLSKKSFSKWDKLQVQLKSPTSMSEYMMAKEGLMNDWHVSEHRLLDLIEKEVKNYDDFLSTQTKSLKEINDDCTELKEYRQALKHAQEYLFAFPKKKKDENSRDIFERSLFDREESRISHGSDKSEIFSMGKLQIHIGHMIGVIATEDLHRFQVLIFRGSRGKVLVHTKEIKTPKNSKTKTILKSTFVLTFQEGTNMRDKLERICEGVKAKLYEYPENNLKVVLADLDKKILETNHLLKNSNTELRNYLIKLNDLDSRRKMGGNSPYYGISTIQLYKTHILIEEEIYRNMNWLKSYENK